MRFLSRSGIRFSCQFFRFFKNILLCRLFFYNSFGVKDRKNVLKIFFYENQLLIRSFLKTSLEVRYLSFSNISFLQIHLSRQEYCTAINNNEEGAKMIRDYLNSTYSDRNAEYINFLKALRKTRNE